MISVLFIVKGSVALTLVFSFQVSCVLFVFSYAVLLLHLLISLSLIVSFAVLKLFYSGGSKVEPSRTIKLKTKVFDKKKKTKKNYYNQMYFFLTKTTY